MNTLLSVGQNRKLGKKVAVFNLPQGIACPGATEVCKKICYAAKAERIYKTARDKRAANHQAVLTLTPTDLALKLIQEITAAKVSQVRVHESGDFFNQAYLDTWFKVAAMMPHVSFLAYTKSFNLNFDARPANFSIYLSIDSSTKMNGEFEDLKDSHPTARIVLKGETPVAGELTCQHASKEHYCGTECTTCFQGKRDVYFLQH